MNTEALLRLADKLQGVGPYEEVGPIPSGNFNMHKWSISTLEKAIIKVFRGKYVFDKPECQTVACACGWAGIDPWFQERGFYTSPYNEVMYFKENGLPHLEFFAVSIFFDISYSEAKYLFMPAPRYIYPYDY